MLGLLFLFTASIAMGGAMFEGSRSALEEEAPNGFEDEPEDTEGYEPRDEDGRGSNCLLDFFDLDEMEDCTSGDEGFVSDSTEAGTGLGFPDVSYTGGSDCAEADDFGCLDQLDQQCDPQSRVLVGTDASDILPGGDTDQTLYHNSSSYERLITEPHSANLYRSNVDASPDTLEGGAGDDIIYFGTGDQIESGSGSDTLYGYLDIPDESGVTEVADFQIGLDKIVMFIPPGSEVFGVIENHSDEEGMSITIETSSGNFSMKFPDVHSHLNLETIEEEYDPDQHPLLFLNQLGLLDASVFIIKNSGYL